MEMYDLMVLGGGPGGYLCAERAAQGGMKVVLFEQEHMGGTCLNEGCIPTKTLLNSAKLYRHATGSADFGVTAQGVVFDHAKAVERKSRVVKTLVSGVEGTMRSHKITVVRESAVIAGRGEKGFLVKAGNELYNGARLTIATGSETVIPPVKGLKEGLADGFVVTNKEVLDLDSLPKELVVIGGGVIGLEMACYFASVGSHVTVIEMMPKIAGATDADICRILMDIYGKSGMEFKLSCKVLEVGTDRVIYEENGEKKTVCCDKVLLSAGRRASTAGIGLETLGIEQVRGAITTDKYLCTNVANVYAVGDCNGKLMLAHTAYREAEVAVNHMLGIRDEMRYDVIPSVIYTDPEVACVGLSLEAAREKGINAKEIKLPMMFSGRYVAENENGKGFIKLIVDTDKKRLLGCHMIGSYASETILAVTMMIDTELPPSRLQKIVFPHPTVGEVIREALFTI